MVKERVLAKKGLRSERGDSNKNLSMKMIIIMIISPRTLLTFKSKFDTSYL
jgi:hypothetical protein